MKHRMRSLEIAGFSVIALFLYFALHTFAFRPLPQDMAALRSTASPMAPTVGGVTLTPTPTPTPTPGGAATIVVTSAADSGPGTLRQALLDVQDGDTITFDLAVFSPTNPVTIVLTSALPELNQGNLTIDASNAGVILDGSNVPAAESEAGLLISSDGNRVMGLQIVNFPVNGVQLHGGASHNIIGGDSTVGAGPIGQGNLISGNAGHGVVLYDPGTNNNTLLGNRIGTDLTGMTTRPNALGGVLIAVEASQNTVGGAASGERNLISGNGGEGIGIYGVDTMSNTISNNYIGTSISGTVAVGNSLRGIYIGDGAQSNFVSNNLISGNGNDGVIIAGSGTMSNTLSSNFIGVDASGTAAIGNAGIGVWIGDGAQYNLVGGDTPGERNIISGNKGGVNVEGSDTMSNTVSGNYIGTDGAGTAGLGNEESGVRIGDSARYNVIGGDEEGERNVISANGRAGIEISGASDNIILGNYLGTDANGMAALGNYVRGIEIHDDGASLEAVFHARKDTTANEKRPAAGDQISFFGAVENLITGNLISGNGCNGVDLYGSNTFSNTVAGNRIGTDAMGKSALGNGCQGIWLGGGAHHNTIGGSTVQERNVISGNNWGVGIEEPETADNRVTGNFIGLDISGTAALGNNNAGVVFYGGSQRNTIGPDNTIAHNGTDGVIVYGSTCVSNTISHNSIYSNTEQGIDLMSGANANIQPPVIVNVNTAAGSVTGTGCPNCTIEIFSDDDDEGRWYEGSTTSDGVGNWSFNKGSAFTGFNVHATATDPAGNTSEFSGPPPVVATVSPGSAAPGTHDLDITVSGDHFRDDEPLTVDFSAGVTVTNTRFISRTQIKVYLDVDSAATLGPRDVTVTNYDGQSGTATNAFTVTATSPFSAPVVSSITPTVGLQGKRMDLTVYGQSFVDRPTIAFNSGDITVNSVTVISATELLVNIVISPSALAAPHDLTVTNPDGQSDTLPQAFKVQVRLFTDVSYWAGIGTRGQRGVAWGDYDNDGYVDLFVSNHNVLYHNNGDGTFTDVTEAAGGLWWGGEGVAWGDYDNDSDLDLYISDWGDWDTLYRNEGDNTFTRVTDQAGLQDPGHGQTAAWGDYDRDGYLDLYITNAEGDPNHLYHNEGDGTFSDVTAQALVTNTGYSPGVAWADYDSDGDADLYVTDSDGNRLFQNRGDGTFVNRAIELGVTAEAYGGGVGAAWGDYDNDGDLDLAISAGGTAVLFRNDGNAFADVTTSAGVGSAGIGGMGVAWADYDNDGWLDLYVTSDEGGALYHNNGDGTFADVTEAAGVDSGPGTWGSAWGDYDHDGDLDLFVVKGGLPELGQPDLQDILYRNNGNSNHWLHVRTVGTVSNRAGIGARVRVIAGGLSQIREVSGGSGRTSQDSLPVEFGLGDYDGPVVVEVTWPSGAVTTLSSVALDQVLVVNEPPADEHDFFVVAINQPKPQAAEGTTVTPRLTVRNLGSRTESNVPVRLVIEKDTSQVYSQTVAIASLDSLLSTMVSFPSFPFTASGQYTFTFTSLLPSDQNASNDQQQRVVNVSTAWVDIWTKDNPSDNGDVPTAEWWQSPDIWVRRQNDGGLIHQDPVAGVENYVYVRVRNRGNITATNITVDAYWHGPAVGIICGDWSFIGSANVAQLPAEGSEVVVISWTPTRTGHTCLYDVIYNDKDPVSLPCDVPGDNNIEQRNVEILTSPFLKQSGAGVFSIETAHFQIANVFPRPADVDLNVTRGDFPLSGSMVLKLDTGLFDRWWAATGGDVAGGRVDATSRVITLTDALSATVRSLPMYAEEKVTATLELASSQAADFTIELTELINGQPVGGSVYSGHTCQAEDLNCDGKVDVHDIQRAATAWNSQIGDMGYDLWVDLDQDGQIDIRDVQKVAAAWAP